MKIGKINSAFEEQKMAKQIRKNAKVALDNLMELYGNKFDKYDVFTNSKGTATALGYPKYSKLYSHAYTILSDGTHIQKVADRKQTLLGTITNYMTLVKNKFGNFVYSSRTVGAGKKANHDLGTFRLREPEGKVIYAADLFLRNSK